MNIINDIIELSRDNIFRSVTAHILTKSFSKEEFQAITCTDYVTEPFEDWDEYALYSFITNMTDTISSNLLI